jgi:hypothetical protein
MLRQRTRAQGNWSPLRLFSGIQGAWYDPSDLSTLFQDTAGTTPAAVNSRVALMRDKGGGGFHVSQATTAAQPFLRSGSGLFWLEFDGSDDQLQSAAGGYAGVGAIHYVAAGIDRRNQNTGTLFGIVSSATNFHRIVNAGSGERVEGSYRNAGGVHTASTAGSSVPIAGTQKVLESLAKAAYIDAAVNGVVSTGTSTTTGADTLAAARVTVGDPTVIMNFVGGICLTAEPGALDRSRIQQYLAAKAGVSF